MPKVKKSASIKGSAAAAASTTADVPPNIAVSIKGKPPAPFSTPNPVLKAFLEGLNPKHIYLTHIDRHPRKLKRNIFIVPILLNVVVAGLLIWRIKYVAPYYGALLLTFFGGDSPTNIDTANTPWHELINAVFNRTGTLFVDFCIFRFLAPWPMDFFVGERSPAYWRTAIGFQDAEIVVRRSRRWDEQLPAGWLAKQEDDGSEAAAVWKDRIMPAIDRKWIRAKTGYLMMDKNWDLDFLAMTVSSNMVIAGENETKDFDKSVIAYSEDFGWLVWPVWKLDDGVDGERRRKIVLFKEKLTGMGKESLFFRWIEIIQFESSKPGGFTPERQTAAMEKARELFEAEGVDFDRFWEEVGGMEGLPGLTK